MVSSTFAHFMDRSIRTGIMNVARKIRIFKYMVITSCKRVNVVEVGYTCVGDFNKWGTLFSYSWEN